MNPNDIGQPIIDAYQLGFDAARRSNISSLHFLRGFLFGVIVVIAVQRISAQFL
jgi:hypothetical protein